MENQMFQIKIYLKKVMPQKFEDIPLCGLKSLFEAEVELDYKDGRIYFFYAKNMSSRFKYEKGYVNKITIPIGGKPQFPRKWKLTLKRVKKD